MPSTRSSRCAKIEANRVDVALKSKTKTKTKGKSDTKYEVTCLLQVMADLLEVPKEKQDNHLHVLTEACKHIKLLCTKSTHSVLDVNTGQTGTMVNLQRNSHRPEGVALDSLEVNIPPRSIGRPRNLNFDRLITSKPKTISRGRGRPKRSVVVGGEDIASMEGRKMSVKALRESGEGDESMVGREGIERMKNVEPVKGSLMQYSSLQVFDDLDEGVHDYIFDDYLL